MTFLTRNWRAVSSTMASVMLVGLVGLVAIGLYGRASVKISDESGDRWL
ncbi:MAG: hypothetical protein ACP5C4_08280 [Methanomicrobiales archaeon]